VPLGLVTTTHAGRWSWFPWGVLRSAGFPVRWIDALGNDDVPLRAADSLIASDREIARAARALIHQLPTIADQRQRRRLRRALDSQRPIKEALSARNIENDVQNWNLLVERRVQAAWTFDRAYEQERQASTERLLRIFEQDGFRRAVLWQNRRVVPFLLKAKDSWDERALLKYLTRYVTKNDTVGFFGPVTWIRASNEPGFGELRWGRSITRATLLSFEMWPITVIAERLANDKDLRPWLSPRRSALCRVRNHYVFMPPDRQLELSDEDIDIVQRSDGRRTAREIAMELALDDLAPLDTLHRAGLITWTLECPLQRNPESIIEELATRIDDHQVRATVESHSRWLGSAIEHLREGMGHSTSLAAALAQTDSEFEQRYSREAVQNAGQYYAGRTLTYIDCERDVTLSLHADLLNTLMQGVSPILLSLRWYTFTVIEQFVPALAELVPYGQVRTLADVFPHALNLVWSAIQDVAAQYRAKWLRLMAIDPVQRTVRFDAVDLVGAVKTTFAAPHPGWPMARVHNPDVLIAAESHAELARGNFTLVLGEVHASLPSMFQSAIFSFCPEPARVREMFHSLVPPPPVINELSPRLNFGDFFVNAAQLWLPDDPVTHFNVRPIADFDVCHGKAGLRVRDVTTQHVWSIPVFFDTMLSRATFHIDPFDRPHDAHSPRILFGDVVVSREMWRVTADAFGLADRRRADSGERARNFLAVRRWAGENGVPRYTFAKSAKEPKPLFLDLESQKCVELLCHLLKRAAAGDSPGHVMISEMLPEPARCWLRDEPGERYTSELRLLAVDPVPYPQD
jgi:hypothetical protein